MAENHEKSEKWDLIISPKIEYFDLHFRDLWRYKDLIFLFVRRDFVAFYKQTVLGPLWYFLQPLFTTIVFTVIFGKVARISTDGIPPFLFYLSGTVMWGYFSSCLNEISRTFVSNAGIFGKVYFPRLTVPISVVIIALVRFAIQLFLFLGFWAYFVISGSSARPTPLILWLPILIFQMALLGLGTGALVTSLTTKYRDLIYLMGFAVQLWMYATPVVYPVSIVPEKYRFFYMLNPMASIVEMFRFAFLGKGMVEPVYIITGWGVTLFVFFVGMVLFTRVEKTFMDTV